MTQAAPVLFRKGRLYFTREACERHFPGSGAVALIRAGPDLLILPVRHAASGGYLLKLRTSAGERVAAVPDFFRAEGMDDDAVWSGQSSWEQERAALVLHDFFLCK